METTGIGNYRYLAVDSLAIVETWIILLLKYRAMDAREWFFQNEKELRKKFYSGNNENYPSQKFPDESYEYQSNPNLPMYGSDYEGIREYVTKCKIEEEIEANGFYICYCGKKYKTLYYAARHFLICQCTKDEIKRCSDLYKIIVL